MIDFDFIAGTRLFSGITPDEIKGMVSCLKIHEKHFEKGETVFSEGTVTKEFGMVYRGSLAVENVDFWGNRNLLSVVEPGKIFAESYAALSSFQLLVGVTAREQSDVLFFEMPALLSVCKNSCSFHNSLISNLVAVTSRKNIELSRKIQESAPKTIRDRLLAFLSRSASQAGSAEFDINFDRQELADYLGIDRSAMSAELSKMKNEGIIETRKSHFILKRK